MPIAAKRIHWIDVGSAERMVVKIVAALSQCLLGSHI